MTDTIAGATVVGFSPIVLQGPRGADGTGSGGGTATPLAHADTHTLGGTDPVTLDPSQITGLNASLASLVASTRTVSSGTGLSGGGDLSTNRTLAVVYGTTAGTAAQGNDSRITGAVQSTRTITPGTGLSGGGDLSADRSLAVIYGTASGTAAQGNDSRITGAIQSTAKGAANGVADLDAGGFLPLSRMAPGGTFYVIKVGANWTYAGSTITTRPTSRTDLVMRARSLDGTIPSFALTGDIAEVTPS